MNKAGAYRRCEGSASQGVIKGPTRRAGVVIVEAGAEKIAIENCSKMR